MAIIIAEAVHELADELVTDARILASERSQLAFELPSITVGRHSHPRRLR